MKLWMGGFPEEPTRAGRDVRIVNREKSRGVPASDEGMQR